MNNEENKIYLDKIEEIGDKVYDFYNLSGRKDLIMVYEMQQDKIFSYIFKEFFVSLNARSRKMLAVQYKEARAEKKIVLFIRDEARKKFKSFTI